MFYSDANGMRCVWIFIIAEREGTFSWDFFLLTLSPHKPDVDVPRWVIRANLALNYGENCSHLFHVCVFIFSELSEQGKFSFDYIFLQFPSHHIQIFRLVTTSFIFSLDIYNFLRFAAIGKRFAFVVDDKYVYMKNCRSRISRHNSICAGKTCVCVGLIERLISVIGSFINYYRYKLCNYKD